METTTSIFMLTTRQTTSSLPYHWEPPAGNFWSCLMSILLIDAVFSFHVRHLSCFGKTLTRKRKPLTTPSEKEVTSWNTWSPSWFLLCVFQYKFSLTNGSLIVMAGDTQKYWKHSLLKDKKATDCRINLTFRIMQDRQQWEVKAWFFPHQ